MGILAISGCSGDDSMHDGLCVGAMGVSGPRQTMTEVQTNGYAWKYGYIHGWNAWNDRDTPTLAKSSCMTHANPRRCQSLLLSNGY